MLDSLIKYLIAAILITVPLYPKFPLIRVSGTFVAIRFEDLIMGFSAIVVLVLYLPKWRDLIKNSVFSSIIIFLIVGLISILSSFTLTYTTIPHISFLHWLRRIEYFIPFFLVFEAYKKNRRNLEFFYKILLLVVVVSFIFGFGQRHFRWPMIITQNEEYSKGIALRWVPGSHINSTFAGHYDLATFLVLVMPIIICSLFLLKGRWTRFLISISGFCGLWLLVNSASRISLVSYLVSTTVALFLVKKLKAIILVLIVSIAFTFLSPDLLARYERIFEVLRGGIVYFYKENLSVSAKTFDLQAANLDIKRRNEVLSPTPIPIFEDRSTNIRLNVEWPRALRAFLKNPLLGTGYSSITLATDNDYLRLLGEVGILGFLAFVGIFISIFQILIKSYPFFKNFKTLELGVISGVSGSLFGVFMNAVFIDVFEASKFAIMFWLFIGLTISIAQNNE